MVLFHLVELLIIAAIAGSTNVQPQTTEKYIFVEQIKTYTAAQTYCEETYSTSLASIHTQIDNDAAISLCLNSTTDCWIGLNDLDTEGDYVWTDGTTFDYGSDISGGVSPWLMTDSNSAPDNEYGIEDCVLIDGPSGGVWNDFTCNYQAYFICNKPSQLCDESNWNILSRDISFDSCEINSNGDSMSIINNQQWIHGNTSRGEQYWYFILAEYQFTFNDITGESGDSGIVLYHYPTICDYVFVGISMKDNGNGYVFIDKYVNNTRISVYESSALAFTVNYGEYYILKITIAYQSFLTWLINFGTSGYYIAGGAIQGNYPYETLPTFIGLKNVNTSITAKSFYTTDANNFDIDNDFCWKTCISNDTDCSISSTMNPDTTMSDDATMNPTDSPTDYPTQDPTTNPLEDASDHAVMCVISGLSVAVVYMLPLFI